MRLRTSQSIGFQYMLRMLAICLAVLCGFLLFYSGVQLLQQQSRYASHFKHLQKTLSPPLLAAARLHQREQIKALFAGVVDGQGLVGIRFIQTNEGWQESLFRSDRELDVLAEAYRFELQDTRADGQVHKMTVELFANTILFDPFTGEHIALVLSLVGFTIVFLLIAISLLTQNSLVKPIKILQAKIAQMSLSQILAKEDLIEARREVRNEFEDLENSFLQLLRQLQLEHREALLAKRKLANLNTNLAAELQLRQKQLEDQLAQSVNDNKLTALGEMAGGIAHEINNPLAILIGRTAQLRKVFSQTIHTSPQLESILGSMEKTIYRIQDLISDLETISRQPSAEERKPLSIERLLQRVCDVAEARFVSKGLKLELRLAVDATVLGREVELTQALLYIVENAAEASLYHALPWVRIELAAGKPDFVTLLIIDSGPGVPSDIRDKIFLPFFTTKDVGAGRGVGLSLAKSMIESNQGQLAFDFHAGQTTICISLPRHKELEAVA